MRKVRDWTRIRCVIHTATHVSVDLSTIRTDLSMVDTIRRTMNPGDALSASLILRMKRMLIMLSVTDSSRLQ
jgi:hypothetical protein